MIMRYWLRASYTRKIEVVKTIRTDIEGVASTSSDLLPYGNFRIVESEAPDGYLTDGAKPIDFTNHRKWKNRGLNRRSPFYLQSD